MVLGERVLGERVLGERVLMGKKSNKAERNDESRRTLVGTIGSAARAEVDERGAVSPIDNAWSLDWWIGGDDRWHVPARESSVRQSAVESAPVLETLVHVPNGNIIQRVYGVSGAAGLIVVDIQNRSPGAVVIAFTIKGSVSKPVRSVSLDGTTLVIDGTPALVLPFAPSRWFVSSAGELPAIDAVVEGLAKTGPFPSSEDSNGLEVVIMYPLAHAARMRIALALGEEWPDAVALAELPSADDAARGWLALLDRATRVVLPDQRLMDRVMLSRSQVLLNADGGPVEVAALEDWGFDSEAEYAWHGLRLMDRRKARRRPIATEVAASIETPEGAFLVVPSWPSAPSEFLVALRQGLVCDTEDGVALLSVFPSEWYGQPVEVHAAPTRHGLVSFALRWHGSRPALLWEVTGAAEGLVVTAPGLDSQWSSRELSGDALLSEPVNPPISQ
ncbi:unannotated protein [freshwater metagenome]|uniref:Unannotated protein n=1 Tax=freshwater metagenome TaxID=449393 RepID=A0A6J6LMG5_9ZZZZ